MSPTADVFSRRLRAAVCRHSREVVLLSAASFRTVSRRNSFSTAAQPLTWRRTLGILAASGDLSMNTRHLFALVPLLVTTACALPPVAPAPASAPKVVTPVVPAPTSVATLVVGPAPTVETCPSGENPSFVYGFASLKQRL